MRGEEAMGWNARALRDTSHAMQGGGAHSPSFDELAERIRIVSHFGQHRRGILHDFGEYFELRTAARVGILAGGELHQ